MPTSTDHSLEIYLAKPGATREGPFSLDKLNLELAAGNYRSGDYWAWHEGMAEWVPLYDIKGVTKTSTPADTGETVVRRASVLASPDISTPDLASPTEPCDEPTGLDPESAGEVPQDVPELCAHTEPEALTSEDRLESEPPAPLADSEPFTFALGERFRAEPAETAEQELADIPPLFQMAVNPRAEQPDEAIEGALLYEDTPVQNGLEADSVEALAEPAEPLSTDGTSPLTVPDANDPVASAETPQAILARLKKSFLQTPEPSNEVTSYFNAGRAITPQGFEASAQTSGHELAQRDGAQPVEPQSGASTEASGPGSSPEGEYDLESVLLAQQYSSGMPFAALEQIFLFTTGDGPSVWSSPIVKRMLEAVVGEKLDRIRQSIPRDVIFNCDLGQLVKRNGSISDAVWNAMEIREPSVVARARQKLSCTCVRTFHLETGTVVALILYYNNRKLNPGAASPEPDSRAGRFAWSASAVSPGFPLSR